jgi:hypothetical protein
MRPVETEDHMGRGNVVRYWISPHCKGPQKQDLALCVLQGHLIVVYKTRDDEAQLWIPVMAPGGNVALVNSKTSEIAFGSNNHKQVEAVALSEQHLNGNGTWDITNGLTNSAVRPARDKGMNLNVRGRGPTYETGTQVILWNWGGGGANERWDFLPYDF